MSLERKKNIFGSIPFQIENLLKAKVNMVILEDTLFYRPAFI